MAQRGVFDDLALPVTSFIPEIQVTATAQASGVIPVAAIVGATFNVVQASAATSLATPTAAALYAQLVAVLQAVGIQVPQQNIANSPFFANGGPSWEVRFSNTSGGTLAITAGSGVTLVGTFTGIATLTCVDAVVVLTSPTTATITRIGSGAN